MRPIQGVRAVKVNAGQLDRRLTLYALGGEAGDLIASYDDRGNPLDEFGAVLSSFGPYATIYAQRLEMRTVDAARAGGRDTYTTARYLIRYRADVTTKMQASIDGQRYDIVSIDQPDRRTTLILTLEETL